jgi:hypothetical protein
LRWETWWEIRCLVLYLGRLKNESLDVGRCQPASCFPKSLAVKFSKTELISHLAAQHQVSRKFLYNRGQKLMRALDATFSSTKDEPECSSTCRSPRPGCGN